MRTGGASTETAAALPPPLAMALAAIGSWRGGSAVCGMAASARTGDGAACWGGGIAGRSDIGIVWMRGSTFWISVRGRCGRSGLGAGRRAGAAGAGAGAGARPTRHRLLVAQDHLPRMGQLLALQNRRDDVGVDVSVIPLDPHTDGLQLEDEVLIGDRHHLREVLDSNLSHIF